MHLATRGNNKILRTPPLHILPRLTHRTLAQLRTNHPSSNHTYTKSMQNHIHHHYAPSVTLTYTTSLQLHPHKHYIVSPGFVAVCSYTIHATHRLESRSCFLSSAPKIIKYNQWQRRLRNRHYTDYVNLTVYFFIIINQQKILPIVERIYPSFGHKRI